MSCGCGGVFCGDGVFCGVAGECGGCIGVGGCGVVCWCRWYWVVLLLVCCV